MALNPKQQRFVAEYLKDSNATQAAIRAGYSAKTAGSQGHDLLKKPEISAAVQEALQEHATEAGLSIEWVLSGLKREAEAVKNRASDRIRARELVGRHLKMFDAEKGPPAPTTVVIVNPYAEPQPKE